jgi:hypothetical protein
MYENFSDLLELEVTVMSNHLDRHSRGIVMDDRVDKGNLLRNYFPLRYSSKSS